MQTLGIEPVFMSQPEEKWFSQNWLGEIGWYMEK